MYRDFSFKNFPQPLTIDSCTYKLLIEKEWLFYFCRVVGNILSRIMLYKSFQGSLLDHLPWESKYGEYLLWKEASVITDWFIPLRLYYPIWSSTANSVSSNCSFSLTVIFKILKIIIWNFTKIIKHKNQKSSLFKHFPNSLIQWSQIFLQNSLVIYFDYLEIWKTNWSSFSRIILLILYFHLEKAISIGIISGLAVGLNI